MDDDNDNQDEEVRAVPLQLLVGGGRTLDLVLQLDAVPFRAGQVVRLERRRKR